MRIKRQGGFLVAKIHQAGGRVFARLMKARGIREINSAQGRILFALWRADGIPIRDLAVRTGLDKSTLTSMLGRLERKGLIARVPAPDDRRRVLIRRTDKDRALQARYLDVSRDMTDLFYEDFSEAEIDAFEAALARLLANLEKRERSFKRAGRRVTTGRG